MANVKINEYGEIVREGYVAPKNKRKIEKPSKAEARKSDSALGARMAAMKSGIQKIQGAQGSNLLQSMMANYKKQADKLD